MVVNRIANNGIVHSADRHGVIGTADMEPGFSSNRAPDEYLFYQVVHFLVFIRLSIAAVGFVVGEDRLEEVQEILEVFPGSFLVPGNIYRFMSFVHDHFKILDPP